MAANFGMSLGVHVMWLQRNTAFSDCPFSAPTTYEMLEVLMG